MPEAFQELVTDLTSEHCANPINLVVALALILTAKKESLSELKMRDLIVSVFHKLVTDTSSSV